MRTGYEELAGVCACVYVRVCMRVCVYVNAYVYTCYYGMRRGVGKDIIPPVREIG